MKDLLLSLNQFTGVNSWLGRKQKILLFDSSHAACDIAFMLGGEWDGCNGIVVSSCDEAAINTAANLMSAKWCYEGKSAPVLVRLPADDLMKRYAAGQRNFVNANLRCIALKKCNLSEVNLSWADLSFADLSGANLSHSDLTAATLSETNLSDANLSNANLARVNLAKANIKGANLRGANLHRKTTGSAEATVIYPVEEARLG